MHSNGPRDKEQDQYDSQLSPGLWTTLPHGSYLTTLDGIVATLKQGYSKEKTTLTLSMHLDTLKCIRAIY